MSFLGFPSIIILKYIYLPKDKVKCLLGYHSYYTRVGISFPLLTQKSVLWLFLKKIKKIEMLVWWLKELIVYVYDEGLQGVE